MYKLPVTILNFTGIYELQDIYRCPDYSIIDCTNIEGSNGYCDDIAATTIKSRLSTVPLSGINFIDNGNYHYISLFTIERINEPFTLVVYDHHSDMKEPAFAGLLSCGSWILNATETNKNIMRIILVGISEEQKEMIPETDTEIIVYLDTDIRQSSNVTFPQDYPVYISIDKDVLSKEMLDTTWDQGIMTTDELTSSLESILSDHPLIGVDICGECDSNLGTHDAIIANQEFNNTMIQYFNR